MADNVTLDPGAAGAVIAADDIGSVWHQRVKLEWGAANTANEVDTASGMAVPVQGEAAENVPVTGNPVQVGGRYDLTPRTLNDGDVGGLALAATGNAIVDLGPTDNAVLDTINTAVEATQAAVEIMDDWDESDRAKVNVIAGQAGIAAGTGVDGVTVPRVTLATDVPLPAGTNAIGKLAANDGVDIGNVDVASVPAPLSTTGGGTEAAALRVTLANDSTGQVTIDGTVTANAGTGTMAVSNAGLTELAAAINANELDVNLASSGATVTVDGSGSTQPVSGTVTANAGSVVDANNSTTTPLGGSAAFTGTGTDLLGYSTVCCTLYADVDSATDGMTFQFSSDNSNWDDVYTFTMDISASDTRRFQFPVTARYFRIVYTNGGGAQSAFRVQTILHTANQLTSIHRLANDMNPDRSAQVVKAVLYAQAAGGGDFTAVDATASGNLKTSIQEISDGLDIGAGNAGSETQRVSISTDDVNLSAIKTAVELIDNAIAGSEMQVDVVSGTVTANAGTGTRLIEGEVAHDGADAANPVKVGHKAIAHGATPTEVAANDVTDGYANRAGIPFVMAGHPNTKTAVYYTASAGTDDNILPAIGAGNKYVITRCTVLVDDACSVAPGVRIGFGSTVVPALGSDQGDAVDAVIVDHPGITNGGGWTEGNGGGILGVGGDGEELRITNEVPTGGSIRVCVSYYITSS